MKRIVLLAVAAVLCFAAATSCRNSGKTDGEVQPIEQEVTEIEDGTAQATADDLEPVDDPENPDVLHYIDIEVKPVFQDGNEKAFQKWVADNVQYPAEASENGLQGTVVAQFTVDKEGRVGDVKVLRSVCPVLDAEAVRVIESAPSWKPASHNGEAVDVSFVLPVKFEIL